MTDHKKNVSFIAHLTYLCELSQHDRLSQEGKDFIQKVKEEKIVFEMLDKSDNEEQDTVSEQECIRIIKNAVNAYKRSVK